MSNPRSKRSCRVRLVRLMRLTLLAILLFTGVMVPAKAAGMRQASQAWMGQYFANADLTGLPIITRVEELINFDWGHGSPDPRVPRDNFSARWTRQWFFEAGRYRFSTTTDDGVRLYVDGQLLINQWHPMAATTYTAEIILAPGNHSVRMEYYERGGLASARLLWERVGGPTSPDGAWRGEYYANRHLAGRPALIRFDDAVNFNWNGASPDFRIPSDNFSVRWTRTLDFRRGRYTFLVSADDGVRLYLDGRLLIDDWVDTAVRTREDTITLTGRHTLTLEYYEHLGMASVSLRWEREPLGGRLVGNIITCMRPTTNSWIKVYRMMPDGRWQDMNPEGWGLIDKDGSLKIDGLPIHPDFSQKGQPYRVELWDAGKLVTQVGNTQAGQPEWRLQPFTDNRTPWQCPAP